MRALLNKIGIFPGTFDPIHNGHLEFAQAAAKELNLDKVFFLPERQPRKKVKVTNFAHRLKMLKLAVSDYENLAVLDFPEARFSVSTTLSNLKSRFGDDELTLLIGSDNLANLHAWPGVEKLLSSLNLAIGPRGGDSEEKIAQILFKFDKPLKAASIVVSPKANLTASQLRVREQKNLIRPKVIEYIRRNKLYN